MYFEVKNPEKVLLANGYKCRGVGVHFEKTRNEKEWFHAIIQPNGMTQLHIDKAKKIQSKKAKSKDRPEYFSINKSKLLVQEIKKLTKEDEKGI